MKLEIINGSFAYPKCEVLYNNINASVSDGEILAILGTNGAGKTTLLKCIMNLLNFKTGMATIDGEDIKNKSNIWKIISYVPQSKNVNSSLSGIDMVLLGCAPHIHMLDRPSAEDEQRAVEVLHQLEIQHLSDKTCDEMSGGELQMILIARAIVSNPKILILDEPESNLDFKNQLKILSTIKSLAIKEQIICVINTHYPDHALNLADKVLLIDSDNRCGMFGATNDIITSENLENVFGVSVLVETLVKDDFSVKVVVPFSQ